MPAEPQAADHYAVVKELFREHNRALVNFLLTRLRSEQAALDVAQEAYVRLLQLHRPGAVSFGDMPRRRGHEFLDGFS